MVRAHDGVSRGQGEVVILPWPGRSQPSFLQAERTWERSCVLRVSAQPESLRFLVSGLSEVRNLVPSVFSFSNMAVAQTVLDTVRRASWGKNKKRLICISRYAIKIPGEIAWCGHYRSYSAFKRHNMRCSFEIFLRKGGRNRRLLLASQNCYFLCRRDNFRDRNNAVRINTSFLHVLKVLDFERKLLFSALLTSDFFPGTLTCAWRILIFENNVQSILVFQKKLERKANVESSFANLLLLRTTAS